jgi:hypothetical protein
MAARKRKKSATPIFDSIRKPTAPASETIGERRPEERLHPSLRQKKHKKRNEDISD